MAITIFYIVYIAGGIFRIKHVCGSGGGEFPSMQRRARKRRKSEKGSQKSAADGEEKKK